MSSKRTAKTGSQEPRIRVEPKYDYTDGDDAADLASEYGITPDPWQKLVLDSWFGRDKHDKFTATSCGLSVPRQNGKNGLLEIRELYGMAIMGEKILHTAHEVKTARKAFLRLAAWFENERQYPELSEMVLQVRRTNGQEAIVLNNGGSIEFSARSKNAARGFTVDVVVFDEAQELTDEQVEAILSTMAAAPSGNRQFIYTGTPPGPQSSGTVFARTRKTALDRVDKHLAWHEWSVDKIGDVSDRNRWYETNPALGIRLDEEFTEKEFHTMTADGFARERLGWWASALGKALVTEAKWKELATDEPPEEGKKAFGIKFSPDGATVSLAAALKPKNGIPYVELIEHRSMRDGTQWLADWCIERKADTACFVVDGKSDLDDFTSKLRNGKVSPKAIVIPGTRGVIAAATRTYNAIREKQLSHFDQPALNEAVIHAEKRNIGRDGGWGWGGIADYDVTPMEAISLAYWGVMTTKRNPGRRQKLL